MAVERALEIDGELGEAYASLGFIRDAYDWDDEAATAAFLRSLRLSPQYATAHQWYGTFLSRRGLPEQGIPHLRVALEMDPLSQIININLGDVLRHAGRIEEAESRYRSTLGLFPESETANRELGWLLVARGDYEAALRTLPNVSHVAAYVQIGRRSEAVQMADHFRHGTLRQQVDVAASLGDINTAFGLLAEAVESRHPWLAWAVHDPGIDPLRTDPRLEEVLARVGTPDRP
jgi:hypothetical protein